MDDRCDECGRRKCPTCEQHLEFTLVGDKWLCWMCNNKEVEQSPQDQASLSIEIRGTELIESALNEYWSTRIELYGQYMGLLGHRIDQIAKGTLNQDEYIGQWINKIPKILAEISKNDRDTSDEKED